MFFHTEYNKREEKILTNSFCSYIFIKNLVYKSIQNALIPSTPIILFIFIEENI